MKTMKKNRSLWGVLITACMLSCSAFAQDYKDDMQKIRTAYKSQYHSFSIKYLYYPFDSVKRITDSVKGTCVMDGEDWYYKTKSNTGETEYLKNEKYFIEVNHSNKVIAVADYTLARSDLWNINKVDSLLKIPTLNMNYKEKGGGEGEYTVTLDQRGWTKMKLVFNRKRYTLDEIWLYSSAEGKIFGEPYKKPVIAIFYSSYSEAVPSKNDFNEGKYIQETKGGKFEAVGIFRGFKLLDYVHKRT
jgi:hypothetical protein